MSIRRAGWISVDKSIAGAEDTQDWHITLPNLVRVKPGLVKELLGRCTIFFCWTWTQRTQAWRCWLPCRHYVKSENEASREKRRSRKVREVGLCWHHFSKFCPRAFNLQEPMHPFFWEGECLSLTSERILQIHLLVPPVSLKYQERHWPAGRE